MTKLYCPKCKGELKQEERFTVTHITYGGYGTTYYEEGYRCLVCTESHMKIDCLTEEQHKAREQLYEDMRWEFNPEDNSVSQNKKSETQSDLSITDETQNSNSVELHRFSENDQIPCGQNGGKLDSKLASTPKEGAAKTEEPWINFSDRKPEVGHKIDLRQDIYGVELNKAISMVWNNGDLEGKKWRRAQPETAREDRTVEDHIADLSKMVECEHDGCICDESKRLDCFSCIEKRLSKIERSMSLIMGNIKPTLMAPFQLKPQSQIAI